MFAVKNMDVNSNLLKLKLDMVYKDLTMEEAQKRFEEITTTVETAEVVEPMAETRVGKEKRKRKVVKALVAKS
jgi:ABC-type lipopolysaccharide export system ATPase subunit